MAPKAVGQSIRVLVVGAVATAIVIGLGLIVAGLGNRNPLTSPGTP